ncbi:hypothetical protein DL95DRAFT_386024, partial [Leptodontidium sp. 2 PMI_412]
MCALSSGEDTKHHALRFASNSIYWEYILRFATVVLGTKGPVKTVSSIPSSTHGWRLQVS